MENYTLSDLATATGGNGFGGSSWILIILFALIFGWGGNGYGRTGDYGQFATAASQQEILFGQQFQNLDNKLDRLGNGLADLGFNINNSVKDGNYAAQTAIKDCCCTTQRNTDALRYDMAQMFANSNAQHTAEIQSVKDMIAQNKIETLQGKINQLELQNALCGVIRYPNQMVYAQNGSPFCNYNNCNAL